MRDQNANGLTIKLQKHIYYDSSISLKTMMDVILIVDTQSHHISTKYCDYNNYVKGNVKHYIRIILDRRIVIIGQDIMQTLVNWNKNIYYVLHWLYASKCLFAGVTCPLLVAWFVCNLVWTKLNSGILNCGNNYLIVNIQEYCIIYSSEQNVLMLWISSTTTHRVHISHTCTVLFISNTVVKLPWVARQT